MLSGTFYVHENLDGLKTYARNYSHYGNSFNISMHISYSSYHMECNIHMQLPPYLRCYFYMYMCNHSSCIRCSCVFVIRDPRGVFYLSFLCSKTLQSIFNQNKRTNVRDSRRAIIVYIVTNIEHFKFHGYRQ